MTRILTILTVLLIQNIAFGQTNLEKEIIQKIEIGYSTRWDIEQLFGKGEQIDNCFLNPDNEQNRGKYGFGHANGIQYRDKGIAFICANDGEKISSIYLTAPFTLAINKQHVFNLGEACLGDVFPGIDTIKVSTTGGSYYWSFRMGNYFFYVAKPIEHRNKKHYSDVPSFKGNLEYYKNQPISIVTISLYDKGLFEQDYPKTQNNLYGIRPLYAPKEITHLNCYDMGWPDGLTLPLRPLYALTGGQKSKQMKQGYWKEYGSNHKLVYEGTFKENIKIGIFKYYDKKGNLERTKKYSTFNFCWTYLIRNQFRIKYFYSYFEKQE